MAEFARMRTLEVWYAKLDFESVMSGTKDAAWVKVVQTRIEKARSRSVPEYEFPKMAEHKDGKPVIKDSPPLIFHTEIADDRQLVLDTLARYRDVLQEDRRTLFDRYRYFDAAIKVVGVGSVGTFCAVALFMASDTDPLFLQVKEANPSVLEPYAAKSAYEHHGQRVVVGQRLMQSASDIFLGWTTGAGAGARHFYVRQLRDMKLNPLIETFDSPRLLRYAEVTGWTLARAHARSGDAAIISGYMGKKGHLRPGYRAVRGRLRRPDRTRSRIIIEGGSLRKDRCHYRSVEADSICAGVAASGRRRLPLLCKPSMMSQ